MKSELKAKFLNHLLSKKKDQGFTLIELLVVIIIIGILSAIALPSFLNQANKGKQSEAKQYVATLTRSQQAYYLEEQKFAANLAALKDPIAGSTPNYDYTTADTGHSTGTAKVSDLKSYGGTVFAANGNSTAIFCESDAATTTAVPIATNSTTCGANASRMTK